MRVIVIVEREVFKYSYEKRDDVISNAPHLRSFIVTIYEALLKNRLMFLTVQKIIIDD